MFETAAPVTLQLAFLVGAMTLAAGIGGWRHPELWNEMFDELDRSPGLVLSVAFIAILFGLVLLLLPGGWTDPLAVAVSAIGLASFVEGLVLLAAPHLYLRFVRPLVRFARPWAAFAMLLGIAFILAGLTGRAPA